jgi:hypothetical protein
MVFRSFREWPRGRKRLLTGSLVSQMRQLSFSH